MELFTIGRTLTLKGKTQFAKSRVASDGARWIIRDRVHRPAFNHRGKQIPEGWQWLIQSLTTNDWRWIACENDPHFEVVSIA